MHYVTNDVKDLKRYYENAKVINETIIALKETFNKFELARFASVRPYPFPLRKIRPIDIVDKIKAPTLFVAGKKDPTVHPWHTKELYNKAVCKKEYKEYQNGCHAEDLFLHFKDDFAQLCLDWLK